NATNVRHYRAGPQQASMVATNASAAGIANYWLGSTNPAPNPSAACFFGQAGFNIGTGANTPNVSTGTPTANTVFQAAPPLSGAGQAQCNLPQAFGAGGLSVCMGDCVVRQVSGTVARRTWAMGVHPADNMPLPQDWNS